MKVVWSDRALKTLAAIHARISADSEQQAHRVIDRILMRGDQLALFPLSGRVVQRFNRPNIREIVESPYRIVYRVKKEEVEVIEVFHGARRPPRDKTR
ncbi:MAG TPA: type II toxin-antitoxin system RelE/ParE family toxin [Blastocatellia bacterium]|nr:type II toxin-antitoxin system RelE/ParE family toxin [Blastocatellia bacterium]